MQISDKMHASEIRTDREVWAGSRGPVSGAVPLWVRASKPRLHQPFRVPRAGFTA